MILNNCSTICSGVDITNMTNNTNTFVPNPMLEMLMQREQLMEDIISIVDEYDIKKGFATKDELAEFLCDAVCRNFPAK